MTPEEQQLPKSKIFSAEAYLTTLLTLSLLLKTVPATKTSPNTPESTGFSSKATLAPAALFCPRLTGKDSFGLPKDSALLHLQMGQSGSRGYCWFLSYPVCANSLVWSHLVQKLEEMLKVSFAEPYGKVCWPICICFNENSVSKSHNIFSWHDPAHRREGISLKQRLPS